VGSFLRHSVLTLSHIPYTTHADSYV